MIKPAALFQSPPSQQLTFNARYQKLSERDIQRIISRRHYLGCLNEYGCLSEKSAAFLPSPISPSLRLGVESNNRSGIKPCTSSPHAYISNQELTAELSNSENHHCISSESLSHISWPQEDDWQLMNAAL